MEGIKVIPISDLQTRRRPISGTASLSRNHQIAPTIPATRPRSPRNPKNPRNPNQTTLTPLLEPSIITGTLSLLSPNQTPPPHSCFSFSDASGSVVCDVIGFDLIMIGKRIHVLAWNYIPFRKCIDSYFGLLEIIDWRLSDDNDNVDSFSLVENGGCGVLDDGGKDRYSVCGVVESVSPSFPVGDGEGGNARGFIVEVVDCDRCEFVYFGGLLSVWHSVFLRLVRRGVSLSRLRKKLVYVGKEEGRLMYVSGEGTRLGALRSEGKKDLSCRKRKRRGDEEGGLGMYIGVVRGVYMQGMVIELDEEVWLLMTEESLVLTCHVRVGAILHVKNVHIVNPKFRWGKMLVLGACSKINITTISFSPWETGCHMVSQSKSLLRKFINSLSFPARLWVLLVVQCFRKKFSGLFSEKEILGTKHKEGLVQSYARRVLPSLVCQLRDDLFMNFGKHDSCCTGSNVTYGCLSLAVPLSNFFSNCDRLWFNSVLELKSGYEILQDYSQVDHPFRENKLSDLPIRRAVLSKDIGISLVGNLKLSQDTGRLQLTDATGCIDVVIPNLPSDWKMNVLFEVVDYTLILEGRPGLRDQTWVLDADLFSCNSIFCSLQSGRQTELTVYVHFHWTNVRLVDLPVDHGLNSIASSAKVDPGVFHLLCLVHKFPLQPQFHGDFHTSDSCRLFAEVMVLPWNLNVVSSANEAQIESFSKDGIENCSRNNFAFKRCKTFHASRCMDKSEFCRNFENFGNNSYSYSNSSDSLSFPHKTRNSGNCGSSSVQVPCTVSIRGRDSQTVAGAGTLCSTQGVGEYASVHPTSSRKLLLEFNYKNMFKYKLMHIGVYYIMKHHAGKCFCDDRNLGNKVAINMETHLWSTSFNFNPVASSSASCNEPASCSCLACEVSSSHHLQNELVLHPGSASHGSFYDVSLHIATDTLDVGVKALKDAVSSMNVSMNGQQAGCMNSMLGNFQNQGACFGSSLPEGNLISLRGTVMRLHHHSNDETAEDIHRSKNWNGLISLLVLTEGQMLQVGGHLSKHNYPVGLSSGADVTFHRILALRGQNRLILTSVSFITVHAVKEALPDCLSYLSVREETIPSCLISDLLQSDTCKPKRLRCRVVGVYIVILERDKNLDKLLSCIRSGITIVDIPYAGFILDDGSSRCFCWANGERAATFLRLHDKAPLAVMGKSCSTTNFHLNKILKKHGRITLKNSGSIHDTMSQDLHLSNSSDCVFGIEDQNLLKFIIFNACSSTFWSITGHVMDSNSVNVLEKYLMDEKMTVHTLQNVWARDVTQVNALAEARVLFQELEPESVISYA